MKKLAIYLIILSASPLLYSDWQLWTGWDSESDLDDVAGMDFNDGNGLESLFEISTDPFTDRGSVLAFAAPDGFVNTGGFLKPMPEGAVTPGDHEWTFYCAIAEETTTGHTFTGLDYETTLAELEVTSPWGARPIRFHDASVNGWGLDAPVSPGEWVTHATYSGGHWYEYWIVIDPVNFEWDWYVRGGPEFPEQTLLAENMLWNSFPDVDTPVEGWLRSMKFITFTAGEDNPGGTGIQYVDDYYLNLEARDLSTPGGDVEPQTWAGLPVTSDGDVNTETWMGWLNVTHKPWVWVYLMDKYMYLPEPAEGAAGAWGYVIK